MHPHAAESRFSNTFYDLLFTIHSISAAAYCRQNRNLAIVRKRGLKQLLTPHIFVVQENVYVLAQLPFFIQHSIAQPDMSLPQTSQRLANSRSRRIYNDLTLPAGKVS